MIDDLLRQIRETIESEDNNKESTGSGVSFVIGNDSTIVIGDGNRDIGRRDSDRPKGEGGETKRYGRRASDQAIRDELNQLRCEVNDLAKLINTLSLKEGSKDFKDDLPAFSDCLSSNGRTPRKAPGVPFCSRLASKPLVKPRSRAIPRPVPIHPIQSRFIPDVSYLMAAHSGSGISGLSCC